MDGYSIFELEVPEDWNGKKIGELDIRNKYNINILGVKNGKMDMNIGVDTVMRYGETMLVLGKTQSIQKLFYL